MLWIRITLVRVRILIFYFMRIRIRLFTLMRIRILASNKRGLKPLKKCLNRLIFHTFWLDICKLIRIRFRIQLITFDVDPDADLGYQYDAGRIRSRVRSRILNYFSASYLAKSYD